LKKRDLMELRFAPHGEKKAREQKNNKRGGPGNDPVKEILKDHRLRRHSWRRKGISKSKNRKFPKATAKSAKRVKRRRKNWGDFNVQ